MHSPTPTPTITGIGESLFSAFLPFLHNSHLSLASEPHPAHGGSPESTEEWRVWAPHLGVVAERSYLA